jgi:nucleotide-binding universal stress UspA family protein
MYKTVCVPVDNSEHSNTAMHLGVQIGKACGARMVGTHVYAAKLHDVRFKQMEFTLPDEYKEETELEKQRRIHDALIGRGLLLISDSYLDVMKALSDQAGLEFEGKCIDGRNFEGILDDVEESDYDLMILGALGQGAVTQSKAGSVCERILRRVELDTLIVRDIESANAAADSAIVVALDGSQWSWGALRAGIEFAKTHDRDLEIVTVQVPGVPGEDLLDAHLKLARKVAKAEGVIARTVLLEGGVSTTLEAHVARTQPWMLVVGRSGADVDAENAELGSAPEYLVRNSPCNVLIVARTWNPAQEFAASERAVA